jgi:hypothetical protein
MPSRANVSIDGNANRKLDHEAPFTQTYQLAAMAKMSRNPMNKKDSMLFAETRSVEKIIVRTSCPWAVPKPVRSTMPRHPPSGVPADVCPWPNNSMRIRRSQTQRYSLVGLACNTFVPLNKTSFLCAPSTSTLSEASNSWIDSLRSGVDSPDSMASLTIHVPWTKRMSAGTTVSDCKRAGGIAVRPNARN